MAEFGYLDGLIYLGIRRKMDRAIYPLRDNNKLTHQLTSIQPLNHRLHNL